MQKSAFILMKMSHRNVDHVRSHSAAAAGSVVFIDFNKVWIYHVVYKKEKWNTYKGHQDHRKKMLVKFLNL